MWSVCYAPKMGLVAPSFQFQADGFAPSPATVDGDSTAMLFEWDQSFAGFMFGLDCPELAFSNIFAVVKSKTAAGFVPGWSGGTVKTRSTTQPPVTAKALSEVRLFILGGGC